MIMSFTSIHLAPPSPPSNHASILYATTGAGPLCSALPQLRDNQFLPPSMTIGSLLIGPGTSEK